MWVNKNPNNKANSQNTFSESAILRHNFLQYICSFNKWSSSSSSKINEALESTCCFPTILFIFFHGGCNTTWQVETKLENSFFSNYFSITRTITSNTESCTSKMEWCATFELTFLLKSFSHNFPLMTASLHTVDTFSAAFKSLTSKYCRISTAISPSNFRPLKSQ